MVFQVAKALRLSTDDCDAGLRCDITASPYGHDTTWLDELSMVVFACVSCPRETRIRLCPAE
ncbi:hypothetical protein LCGC14_2958130, partial [marine sediment metagenome]